MALSKIIQQQIETGMSPNLSVTLTNKLTHLERELNRVSTGVGELHDEEIDEEIQEVKSANHVDLLKHENENLAITIAHVKMMLREKLGASEFAKFCEDFHLNLLTETNEDGNLSYLNAVLSNRTVPQCVQDALDFYAPQLEKLAGSEAIQYFGSRLFEFMGIIDQERTKYIESLARVNRAASKTKSYLNVLKAKIKEHEAISGQEMSIESGVVPQFAVGQEVFHSVQSVEDYKEESSATLNRLNSELALYMSSSEKMISSAVSACWDDFKTKTLSIIEEQVIQPYSPHFPEETIAKARQSAIENLGCHYTEVSNWFLQKKGISVVSQDVVRQYFTEVYGLSEDQR